MFFKSAKRMKESVDRLLSLIHIDPICADPPSSKRKTSIERPLEESVEEYAEAHAALEKRKGAKRLERMKRFIGEVE